MSNISLVPFTPFTENDSGDPVEKTPVLSKYLGPTGQDHIHYYGLVKLNLTYENKELDKDLGVFLKTATILHNTDNCSIKQASSTPSCPVNFVPRDELSRFLKKCLKLDLDKDYKDSVISQRINKLRNYIIKGRYISDEDAYGDLKSWKKFNCAINVEVDNNKPYEDFSTRYRPYIASDDRAHKYANKNYGFIFDEAYNQNCSDRGNKSMNYTIVEVDKFMKTFGSKGLNNKNIKKAKYPEIFIKMLHSFHALDNSFSRMCDKICKRIEDTSNTAFEFYTIEVILLEAWFNIYLITRCAAVLHPVRFNENPPSDDTGMITLRKCSIVEDLGEVIAYTLWNSFIKEIYTKQDHKTIAISLILKYKLCESPDI